MKYKWHKLAYQNYQGCGDCQLVSVVNAYYLLTGKTIKQKSKRYQKFLDQACARTGAAFEGEVHKIITELGMETYRLPHNGFWPPKVIKKPIECNIWHLRYGYHSILIVDSSPKCEAYRVTNLERFTTCDGWIFKDDLWNMLIDNPDKSEPKWRCRGFRLRK